MTDLKIKMWPIEKVLRYSRNARLHSDEQIEQIAASIKEFGFVNPILVDADGVIIAGHGRAAAALKLGMTRVPVIQLGHLTESQAMALRIADNALPLNATWDDAALKFELTELAKVDFNLSLLGFDDLQLVQFMAGGPSPVEDDDVPDAPLNPVSRRGDVWICGDHRVLCGDCRDANDFASVMNGRLINVAITSPPYAEQREYDESSGFEPIAPDDYVEWFRPVSENIASRLADDGSWFINIKPCAHGLDTSLYVMDLVVAHVREWGWHFATEFCWERNGVPKSVTRRFKNQFEPVYQFTRGDWKMRPHQVMHPSGNVPIPGGPGVGQTSWKSAQGGNGAMFGAQKINRRSRPLGVGPTTASKLQGIPGAYTQDVKKKRGFPTGEDRQGTNWQRGMPLGIPREEIGEGLAFPGNRLPTFISTHEALGHAAAFPVGLPEFFIRAYTDPGDVVIDPFLGSGSSLIAADQNGRKCCGIELSPAYVDVSIERWMKLVGKECHLESSKKTFSQVKEERGSDGLTASDRASRISSKDVHRSLSEPRPPNGANVGMRRARKTDQPAR